MNDNEMFSAPQEDMEMDKTFKPPFVQIKSENILHENLTLTKSFENDGIRTGQDPTSIVKKMTFPISPFKKKLKARTGLTSISKCLDISSVHQNSLVENKDSLEASVTQKPLINGVIDMFEMHQIESIKETETSCYNNDIQRLPAVLNTADSMTPIHNHTLNNNYSVYSELNSEEKQRISYMNLLDLSKICRTELADNLPYSTDTNICNQYVNRNNTANEIKVNRKSTMFNGIKQQIYNRHSNIGTLEKEKYRCARNVGSADDERTFGTDHLNLAIMDKKKKLVDRIKNSIIKGGKSMAKENIDLSIVKKELPESENCELNDVIEMTKESSVLPIQQVYIKTESAANLTFDDNISSVVPNVSHFMELPVLHKDVKQKVINNNNNGLIPENDRIVMHKLVCLVCKKTEMVSTDKSSIEGNIFLCKSCNNLLEKGGEPNEMLIDSSKYNILDVTCIRCNLTFSNALEVDMHNKEVHKDEKLLDIGSGKSKRHVKPQFCSDCNKTFTETDAICKHIKSRRHKCEYCQKLFSTNSDLKKHINIHTNEKTYVCIYCNKAFNSRGNMVKHLETHKERKRSFKCEFCNKTFLKSDHLKVHVNTHTNEKLYECPYCKKTFNRKYCLQLHVNIHTLEKIYECHFCNKICMDPSTLRKHIGTHSDERPFKCDFCDKTFKQKPHVTAHMKMHDIKQTFSCSFCDKFFFSKNTLRVHINTHTHEKTFLCIYCQKTFTSKSNLLTHINNKHTVDKTYNCSYCDKVFTDPSTVKKHENIHTKELTYQCAYCNKVFLRKTHLRSHINMHIKYKPYKCKLCDKSFAIKSYLKVHYNIHKGVKPFKCKRCGKAFTSKSNLILHTNSHTKAQLFQCSYCRKDFTQKANLKSHIARSHVESMTVSA